MTTKTEKKVAEEEQKKAEPPFKASDYSCEVILEKTTLDKADDKKLPTMHLM